MKLIALGLNHLTAPVSLREQVAFDEDATNVALLDLAHQPGIDEAMILSTCNRTELYVSVTAGAENVPQEWLNRHHRLTPGKLDEFLYRHDDEAAVRHMFRVATGLDSMVLGEPQILGQVKDAYQQARHANALKTPMDRLLQHTFAVAKRVRTDTRIGAHTVSVAFTAVRLAERVFTDLRQACVLLIGAGDTIELAVRHLAEKQVRRLIVANRTLENAQELAGRHGGYAIALHDLPQHLAEADIVIASTAARQPVLTRAMVEKAIAARRRKPMFMVDIAVPRDIEPAVGELDDVYLYGIDDLRQVIDDNRRSRENAAREADAIIDLQVERYMAWRRALTVKNPAVDLRLHAETYRDEVLEKARAMLVRGKSPDEALAFLANTLTNKLLHHPSARLREAALSGDHDLLHAAGRLYGLDDDTGDEGRVARAAGCRTSDVRRDAGTSVLLLAPRPPSSPLPMTPSIRRKLEAIAERHEEIGLLLGQADVLADNHRFRELSREYAQLEPVAGAMREQTGLEHELADARAMLDDPELREMAADDIARLESRAATLESELQLLLIPKDPRDDANLFLEVRAGAGGDEAAIFAGDLFRMYARHAERQRWQVEVLNENPGEHGGYKEIVARIEGKGAFSRLKFESGVHCVKRVPATESQGRVHTSTATVAVLPELDEIGEIQLSPADLKIDTFRASGAGGQHVNKTDSAIRITHLPSGIVVECQDERSQHKNRARAMSLLKARLLDEAQSKQTAEQAQSRRLQVGTGDRSQRIRTYRYKDNLVTDHRIGLDLYRLTEIMQGDLDELLGALAREHQVDELKSLAGG